MLKNKFHSLSSNSPYNNPITTDPLPFSIWRESFFQKKISKKEEKSFSRQKLKKKEKRSWGKSLKPRKSLSFVSRSQPREASFPETNWTCAWFQNIWLTFTGKFWRTFKSQHQKNGCTWYRTTKNCITLIWNKKWHKRASRQRLKK